ncbi:hypothetical protein ACN38_g4537 [Penicillium nordicum]|uniref:Uncharacterized protein n=1 Tax=Penicillium nordicum TaxID=229535 RepID=A0A0N0RZ58_9EURO|nr:hypothetical protein ACN38_g4537 [Penicillium nordicum]
MCSLCPVIGVDHQTVKATKYQGNDEGSTQVGPSLEYLKAKKRKRIVEYDSTYYQSPLEQPNINGKGKFGEKRQALESIHSVYDRVVQDMDRLFQCLSKANELESDEHEEDEEYLVVVGSDTDVEDTKETAVEAVVKVEEIEKKDVKIVESGLKKEEEEEKPPTVWKKARATRGKGKKAVDIHEK